ncbi:MAG: adenosylmethionine--8-amino-7-oxononanoate transaminase [Actinomycetota bacterium]
MHDAADLQRRDRARVWHPYASMPSSAPAVPVVEAAGTRLRLADGRDAVDGMSSWWAAIHGYRHPALDAALHRQVDELAHVMFGGITHPAAIELSERLVEMSPSGLEHVFLADSGSVSVEVAIKMALQYQRGVGQPERSRLLTVRSGYHGDTLACMSVCDPVNGMHSMFSEILPVQFFAPTPEPPFGDTFEEADIAEFAAMLATHRDQIAAVILEPVVQGAGGMRFYAPAYLAAVRRLCDVHEVLLIADEIATGFGRSGRLFACEHAGIAPDIMCVGKALTGGYMSMAATLCSERVAAGVNEAESGALMHGPTFMGNPLAAAVANASLLQLDARDWRSEVEGIEATLRSSLQPARHMDGVADVRVLGAIGVIEMEEPVDMVESQRILLERGVWLRPFGRLLYTMPPYISSDADLAAITDAMLAVVEAT